MFKSVLIFFGDLTEPPVSGSWKTVKLSSSTPDRWWVGEQATRASIPEPTTKTEWGRWLQSNPFLCRFQPQVWQGAGTFPPRADCFINEFLSALTSLFVRPHSSPVSRDTESSHRVQGRGQDNDKKRTRRGQGPATEDKRRTRPGHRARPREKVSRTLSNHPYKRWPMAFLVQKTPAPGHLFKRYAWTSQGPWGWKSGPYR